MKAKHQDTNSIPPWMSDRAEEFLSLYEPFPDDFGIPDFITPAQWRTEHEREYKCEDTPERRMAWRLFAISVSDCLNGNSAKRLHYIDEIKNWAIGKTPSPRWDFDYWCDLIGYNEDWVRGKLLKFLDSVEQYARLNVPPSEEIKRLLKDVVGKYKSRPTSARKNNMSARAYEQVVEAWTD